MKDLFEDIKPVILPIALLVVLYVFVVNILVQGVIENSQTAEIKINNKIYTVTEICDMTQLGGNIYYDKITGVLYYRDDSQACKGGYSPIYKADGTLKTIEDLK